MTQKGDGMSVKHRSAARWLAVLVAAGAAATAGFVVPNAAANAGDPDSTSATYTVGADGTVTVTVNGTWSWGTNPSGGKDSQSCWSGSKPKDPVAGYDDVSGHWAVGIAVSWNDASTPNTLTGKAVDGSTVTLHVGNAMDWTNPNYCAGTSASAPYPSGSFNATHTYASLSQFMSDTNGGQMCANAYDVHQPNNANESNPAKNGDNTLHNGHYNLQGVDCNKAQQTSAPGSPPATPPTSSAPAPAPAPAPALSIQKLEKLDAAAGYVQGPVAGKVGDTVFYEIFVQNRGNTTMNITLSDPGCDSGTLQPGATQSAIAPGAVIVFFCSHLLVAGDAPTFTNTATASGQSVSVRASTVTATAQAVANVQPTGGVKGVTKVIKVTHRAKPAKAVVKAASFTG